jgi:hypothetical protein
LLLVIPNRSVGNIDLGLMTDDDPVTHEVSDLWITVAVWIGRAP